MIESYGIEMYEKAMSTKRVPLPLIDQATLWLNPTFFSGLGIWMAWVHMYFLAALMVALAAYNTKTNLQALTFDFVKRSTALTTKEQIILQLQKDLNLTLLRRDRQYFRFHSRLSLLKWDSYITILIAPDGYYVNRLSGTFKTISFSGPEPVEEILDKIRELDKPHL
jgi:hypothetical protein